MLDFEGFFEVSVKIRAPLLAMAMEIFTLQLKEWNGDQALNKAQFALTFSVKMLNGASYSVNGASYPTR